MADIVSDGQSVQVLFPAGHSISDLKTTEKMGREREQSGTGNLSRPFQCNHSRTFNSLLSGWKVWWQRRCHDTRHNRLNVRYMRKNDILWLYKCRVFNIFILSGVCSNRSALISLVYYNLACTLMQCCNVTGHDDSLLIYNTEPQQHHCNPQAELLQFTALFYWLY